MPYKPLEYHSPPRPCAKEEQAGRIDAKLGLPMQYGHLSGDRLAAYQRGYLAVTQQEEPCPS